jgi:secretion/DNA translocation related TadE-like protein
VPRRSDRGSATVLVVAAVALVVVVLVGGLALGSAVVATHRARAAADLAALAAAQAVQQGMAPTAACASAASVTSRNGARPAGCTVGGDGSVTCRATVVPSLVLPGSPQRTTTATARAGPSP